MAGKSVHQLKQWTSNWKDEGSKQKDKKNKEEGIGFD